MLNWLRNRRRGELREASFPEEWRDFLLRHVAQYDWLTGEEQERLQGDIQVFIAEKEWEGIKGFSLSDEIKVVIAAQACLLMLGWKEPHYFPNVSTVIVYPAGFHAKSRRRTGYVESEEQQAVLGEAWSGNLPVIVSWDDAREGSELPEDGQNVVFHEFAHKLDMLEGGADGVSPLRGGDAAYDTWAEVMSREFRTLRRSLWEGQESVINSYGAENEAEFFAVITETFFEKPYYLQAEHPHLYDVLKSYYEQDTVSRWRRGKLRENTDPHTDNRVVSDVSFPVHPADYIPEDPPGEMKLR